MKNHLQQKNMGFTQILEDGFAPLVFLQRMFAKVTTENISPKTTNKVWRKKTKPSGSHGFTLVETLVAVTILVIGALGPLAIAAQGISSAGYAKDQITAYYLAQEGVEFVRSVRDTNAIHGHTSPIPVDADYWLQGVDQCVTSAASGNGCMVDIDSQSDPFTTDVNQCSSSGGCKSLRIDGNGYYNYQPSGKLSAFTRTIKIHPSTIDNDNEKIVEVRMDWQSRGVSRNFILTEHIYNYN